MYYSMKDINSAILPIPAGIPFSSILGPTLSSFLHLRRLLQSQKKLMATLADDTAMSSSSAEVLLQSYLDDSNGWLGARTIAVTVGKSQHVTCTLNRGGRPKSI